MLGISVRFVALTVFASSFALAQAAFAQSDAQQDDSVVLHFAALGGVRNWQAGDDDALYIEGRNGMWYRATFYNYCPDIRYEEDLAFVTDSTGDLTKFSSVIAGDQRCYFKTLERTTDPDERPEMGESY